MIPIVSIVGKSGAGKTTLVERLVRELKGRGYRVATIKHDAHRFEIDHPGKDSYRHFHAGADQTLICSPERLAIVRRLDRELALDEVAARVDGVDLILTEGFKREAKRRIEVSRQALTRELISRPEELLAVAADHPLGIGVPVFGLDDAAGLSDLIERELLFPDVTGVVLVGGRSIRMGRDKALLPVGGRPLYRASLEALSRVVQRLLLVGGDPGEAGAGGRFEGETVPIAPDLHPGSSLGGLHAALRHAGTPYVFVLACDMPTSDPALIRGLLRLRGGVDAVVPRPGGRLEPLFAAYSRDCLPSIERLLAGGERRIALFLPEVRTRFVEGEELARMGGGEGAFANLNTPGEYEKAR